jgi:pyridoxamine 5'-phosphate oxidase
VDEAVEPHPLRLLARRREAARAAEDPNAMLCSLATADEQGNPRARTVILRWIADEGVWIFYSTLHGKFEQLEQRQHYEILVWWASGGDQFRISGGLRDAPRADLLRYWSKLPDAHKQIDAAYDQTYAPGNPVASWEELRRWREQVVLAQPPPQEPPEHVVASIFMPDRVEHISASPDRFHQRRLYTREGGQWRNTLLVP